MRIPVLCACILSTILGGMTCSAPPPSLKLSPPDEEFLSKVRYIITSRERKTFLATPAAERQEFIEEFWKKRDPDPATEENEFQQAYLERVEEADRLFSGEGRPGWLTDRGRVYILLGPPHKTESYQGGYMDPTRRIIRDTVIWYYDGIPVVFIDTRGNGEFELDSRELARLEALEVLLSRRRSREGDSSGEKAPLMDFSYSLKDDPGGFRSLVLEIPYKSLWFSEKGKNLETVLMLRLKVTNAGQETVAQHAQDYPLSLSESKLLQLRDKSYTIAIPLLLDAGIYDVQLSLRSSASGEELKRHFQITIPRKRDGSIPPGR